MDETASFGYLIRRRRKALDLTQEKLAEAVGCAIVTIKKIEQDERRPSRQIAEGLAIALRISPDEQEHFLASARGIHSTLNLDLPARPLEPVCHETLHNLPAPVSSFVGRGADLDALQGLICQQDIRLVSVLGPGGIGKTRLALRVAKALLAEFPDGVYFIDLSPLVSGASQAERVQSIANLITQTLAVKAPLEVPLKDALQAYFRPRKMLLVLDNFEHLLDAASLVADFLSVAGDLKVLVTSREALRLPGEYEFLLGPLEETARQQLFSERARAVRKDFTLTAENVAAIAEICRRLDGIPLAIELAAARVRMMSVEEIVAHLDNAFRLLTGGGQAALPRQQTLKAAIDWSYNLLTTAERVLLQRLSVFAGGWTLEAAETVCVDDPAMPDPDAATIAPLEVLDLLGQLVDKSLVVVEAIQSWTRYHLLDTIRQYGHDRLLEAGDSLDVQDRHLAYFAGLTARAEPHLRGKGMLEWLDRLQDELENLRTAIAWAPSSRVELGLQIAADLMWFFHYHGMMTEGAGWNENLLASEQVGRINKPLTGNCALQRARSLRVVVYLGNNANYLPRETAISLLRESLDILRSFAPTQRLELGITLFYYTMVAFSRIDPHSKAIKEALAIFRKEENCFYLSQYFFHLGWQVESDGDLEKARIYLEESLALARKIEDLDGIGGTVSILGMLALYAGDYQKAEAFFTESRESFRRSKNRWGEALFGGGLLVVLGASGNYPSAIQLAQEFIAQERALIYH